MRRYEEIDETKDSSFYIFDVKFLVSVNQLEITSSDYIRQLGFIDSGDSGINREIATENIQTQFSISEMVDLMRKGVNFSIVYKEDTIVIYEYVQHHLRRFATKMNRIGFLNRKKVPVEDLLDLEKLADKIYGHAKYLETGVDDRGYFEKMFITMGIDGLGFTEPDEPDNPEELERETFVEIFKQRQKKF